jgi:hypothetical protein
MYAVGARRAVIFALGAAGMIEPGTAATAAYIGLEVLGVKSLELNPPGIRKISHVGNDRVMAFDLLPTIEGVSGTLTVAGRSMVLDALLGNVKMLTLAEVKLMSAITDQQGSEPDVAVFVSQQAKDASTRSRRYRFQLIPKCSVTAAPIGMNDNPAESKYELAISPTTKHLWGLALSVANDGCLEAGVVEGMTEGRPNIVAWKGNGVLTNFLFPLDKPATAVGKVAATYVDGVLTVPDTITVTSITITTPPTTGKIITTIYEY